MIIPKYLGTTNFRFHWISIGLELPKYSSQYYSYSPLIIYQDKYYLSHSFHHFLFIFSLFSFLDIYVVSRAMGAQAICWMDHAQCVLVHLSVRLIHGKIVVFFYFSSFPSFSISSHFFILFYFCPLVSRFSSILCFSFLFFFVFFLFFFHYGVVCRPVILSVRVLLVRRSPLRLLFISAEKRAFLFSSQPFLPFFLSRPPLLGLRFFPTTFLFAPLKFRRCVRFLGFRTFDAHSSMRRCPCRRAAGVQLGWRRGENFGGWIGYREGSARVCVRTCVLGVRVCARGWRTRRANVGFSGAAKTENCVGQKYSLLLVAYFSRYTVGRRRRRRLFSFFRPFSSFFPVNFFSISQLSSA